MTTTRSPDKPGRLEPAGRGDLRPADALAQAPDGAACVLHCGVSPQALLDATLASRDVVCVDDEWDGCRRARLLSQQHLGGRRAQVRQGPPDVVIGPDERFGVIVDSLPPAGTRARRTDVLSSIGPALALAARQLADDGVLVITLPGPGEADALRDYVEEGTELQVDEVRGTADGLVMTLTRRRPTG